LEPRENKLPTHGFWHVYTLNFDFSRLPVVYLDSRFILTKNRPHSRLAAALTDGDRPASVERLAFLPDVRYGALVHDACSQHHTLKFPLELVGYLAGVDGALAYVLGLGKQVAKTVGLIPHLME